jgi:hypothetical protein
MPSNSPHKPGRNEPCWCGSGKKYKACHLRQDEDEAKKNAPVTPISSTKPLELFKPPEPPKPREPSPEELAEQSEWEKFDQADLEEKIAFFLGRLESNRLDPDDAFEAYLQIRDALNPRHNPATRTRLVELIERLRRDAPEAYQDSPVYLEDLILFAVTEERWDTLPGLLTEFAKFADTKPDEFSGVTKMMLYHGQTQPLLAAMKSAWQKVSTSHDILVWGIDEYYGTLLKLTLYQYLEITATPHADDSELLEAINAFGGKPNIEWLTTAVNHLSASAPSPWRVEDFGVLVDAETWEHNVNALFYDWMADEYHRVGVLFSKSNLFKEELQEILHPQISEREPRRPLKGKHGKSKTQRITVPLMTCTLIPHRDRFERALVDKFNLLGSEPYQAGALVEFLPSYLHFIAKLGLLHPTEMDETFENIKPLIGNTLKLLDGYGADIHLLRAVELAWSDANLQTLSADPDLASARALPVIASPGAPMTAEAQTYQFKVSYRGADDVWFIIETSAKHTLDDLHSAIIAAADFDDDHLHAFYLSGRAWDKETEYGHEDARHSSAISIRKLALRLKQRILYVFDFGDQHEFDVQLIEISSEPPRETRARPRVIERHGQMPPQYPNWDGESEDEEDWDEEDGETNAL